jgi:hypothetical protein
VSKLNAVGDARPIQIYPRVSLNKLGEYLTASPLRRQRILRDQKYPAVFQTGRYREAERRITDFLCRGDCDDAPLLQAVEALVASGEAEPHLAQQRLLCAEAIASFVAVARSLPLSGLRAQAGAARPPRLPMAGVEVSIRPEVLLAGVDRAGGEVRGGLKLYFSKTHPLSPESGQYVAIMLYRYLADAWGAAGRVLPRHCLVLDVFRGALYRAPEAYRRRLKQIEAACGEIAERWERL